MKIGYNPAITASFNSLTATNNNIEKTAKILSTGMRISTASDDAAGVAISEKISSQKAGVDRAIRNSQDGISLLQTAEGGLNQINSMLQRMRELSVQAANESLTQNDRSYIQIEIDELKKNIDDLAHNTTFNRKRLLDGSSAGSWTSDNANTKVHIRGSLTVVDQFGQKKSSEGNYRIEVRAKVGQAEVQKSTIFTMQIDNPSDDDDQYDYTINLEDGVDESSGLNSGYGWNFEDGVLNITESGKYIINGSGSSTENKIKVAEGVKAQIRLNDVDIDVSGNDEECAFDYSGAEVVLFLHGTNNLTSGSGRAGLEGDFSSTLRILKSNDASGTIEANGGEGAAGIGGAVNSSNGIIKIEQDLISQGLINATAGSDEIDNIGAGENALQNSYAIKLEYDPETDEPTLKDIPDFYNSSGVFLLNNPQEIKITQGDGSTTSVMLYATDSMEEVRVKLNNAIANDLGQSRVVDNADNFVTFVKEDTAQNSGLETVAYTFVIRSAIAGQVGELSFTSDNQDLIDKFGLNTIQESTENSYTANVMDAHTGSVIARNLKTSGNMLDGVINPNISVEFDYNANVKASWDQVTKRYVLSADNNDPLVTNIHVVNTSTAFQVGQNHGEDMQIDIADVTGSALGISSVNVLTRERAVNALAKIDSAVRIISLQRTKVGAYQNELEYNANSLTSTSLHLAEAESRITDADMAKEMMEFIKLQIVNNSSSSMLTQSQNLSRGTIQSIMNM